MDIDNLKKKLISFVNDNKIIILRIICVLLLFVLLSVIIYKKHTKHNVSVSNSDIALVSNNIEQETISETKEDSMIRVDIKGAVSKPGVYSLKEGSIVDDVIKLAGGVNKNANTREINLSKKLKDEMVIVIYTNLEIQEFKENKEESNKKECICDNDINEVCVKDSYTNSYDYNSSYSSYHSESKTSKESIKESEPINYLININTASLDELLTLTGIGESKAKSIIEYRKENKFEVIEDIMKVSGIGQSLFDKIKENITV